MAHGAHRQPYVGLRSFREEDHQIFFGRELESHEVAALWQANRLTVLYGSSGVGKSSLLHAGVIPLLDPARTDVLPVGRVSHASAFPLAALPEHNPYTFALLSSWSPAELPTRLAGLTIHEFLRRRGERTDRYGDPVPTLLAIDQAEELFSDFPHRRPYREPFIQDLAEALEELPGLHLLVSLREDVLAAMLPYERKLGQHARARLQLLPFSPAAALEAVLKPLEGTERSFAPGAAESLVDDLRTSRVVSSIGQESRVISETVEPVQLQVVCSALWEALPADVEVITSEDVRRHADVDRALADFCDRVLTAIATDHDLPMTELRSWLHRTFITELGTRGTAYEGLTRTAGMENAVVRALEDRHILRAEPRSGSRWYELQHDRLIQPIQRGGEAAAPGHVPADRIDPAEYLRAAELALADGELSLAKKHAEEAQRTCDENDLHNRADIESFLGNVAHQRGDAAEAEGHYRTAAELFEALQDTSAVGRLLAAIGQVLLAQGRRAEAVSELRAAVARVPGDLTVQTELGWALWHAGHPRAAVPILDGVLMIDGNTPDALRARGEILADLGDARAALRDLDRVRRHPPPSTRAARALALASLGDLAGAEEEIEPAVAEGERNGPLLLYAARVRALSGDQAEAAELARRAIAATDPVLPPHQRDAALQLIEEINGASGGA